ncbi:uncharacterized protein BP5553_10494 [Venustampulla echinocandica]|uniref:Uncharacterized protein n=1 Tax=Venustampulla echinocandica TaxID=2656787 RepID=A0A370T9G6_9HELO|nr:uncharacterized protein BP5553_10494 [Venustampulla echinocandica]RDL30216.1 hypothetical protein BP5553_10494 [Venustampulla echinocandica]
MASYKDLGADAATADAARDELMAWIQEKNPDLLINTFDRPFQPLPHTAKTKAVAVKYEAVGGRHAAQILNVQPEQVQVFSASRAVVYTRFNCPSSQSPSGTTSGKVVTILALGALDHDKGLPGIGSPAQHHKLDSGEVLCASGDALQSFNPNLGRGQVGLAILTLWTIVAQPRDTAEGSRKS